MSVSIQHYGNTPTTTNRYFTKYNLENMQGLVKSQENHAKVLIYAVHLARTNYDMQLCNELINVGIVPSYWCKTHRCVCPMFRFGIPVSKGIPSVARSPSAAICSLTLKSYRPPVMHACNVFEVFPL